MMTDNGTHSIGELSSALGLVTCHGRQVPDITDERPWRHQHENVLHGSLLRRVPEGVREPGVVLHGHRIDGAIYLETSFLELHHRCVIHARPYPPHYHQSKDRIDQVESIKESNTRQNIP